MLDAIAAVYFLLPVIIDSIKGDNNPMESNLKASGYTTTISGLARQGYPESQISTTCPVCTQDCHGPLAIVVLMHAEDGTLRGTSAHLGFVHFAHIGCSRPLWGEAYPADHYTKDGESLCGECLAASVEEPSTECAGEEACGSCVQMVWESEQQRYEEACEEWTMNVQS